MKCYAEAIRLPILTGLYRYHPTERLLSVFLQNHSAGNDTLEVLYKSFRDWAKNTYGIVPEMEMPEVLKLTMKCALPSPLYYEPVPKKQSPEKKEEAMRKLQENLRKLKKK